MMQEGREGGRDEEGRRGVTEELMVRGGREERIYSPQQREGGMGRLKKPKM